MAIMRSKSLHRQDSSKPNAAAAAGGGGGSKNRPPPPPKPDPAWCCIAKPRADSPPPTKPPLDPPKQRHDRRAAPAIAPAAADNSSKPAAVSLIIKAGYAADKSAGGVSPFRLRLSPGKVSPLNEPISSAGVLVQSPQGNADAVNLNSTGGGDAGSEKAPALGDRSRNLSSLLDMMVHEQPAQQPPHAKHSLSSTAIVPKHQTSIQERMHMILTQTSPGSLFNDVSSSDVKLTLSSKEGCCVTVNVHKQTLASQSRFFAAKLSDRWAKQRVPPFIIDISDCDDVEVYLQTIRLMYCRDLKRTLMKENVARVLGILKVSASIVFEAGILSCLEYLEAVPWSEDEEEKVMSLVSQLQLDGPGASEVLTRLSITDGNASQDILSGLLDSVTKGTDDKARREMKALVARMLQENAAQECGDSSKRTLYHACHACIDLLMQLFKQAAVNDIPNQNIVEDRGTLLHQIARQADNLCWLADMLIDQQIADDFLKLWAGKTELATLHSRVPIVLRYEVSRITARLCIAIGKGQVLSPKDVRLQLLQTWFQPLIDDFGWLHRCCKGLDKNVVEEGISQMILTLPLKQQRGILLGWFDRFSTMGDDCPNLQKAFEVWWRRTFIRPCME